MNDIARFAKSLVSAREEYEAETRQELLTRMELLFNRWRHYQSGWDISGSREERDEGFEKALDTLVDAYEFIGDQ